jgi:hypothetical protein
MRGHHRAQREKLVADPDVGDPRQQLAIRRGQYRADRLQDEAVHRSTPRPAARNGVALEHHHVETAPRQLPGGGEPRHPRAHHHHLGLVRNHACLR